MRILGIETSCDETAAAVITTARRAIAIDSSVVRSQINIHQKYGGVVPEVAALDEAGVSISDIDRIAVTRGPGLITSLMVGVETARALAYTHDIPIVGINHLFGHIAVNQLPPQRPLTARDFPAVCLIASGGHTELILLKSLTQYRKIGQTLDDAAGEAFDKTAKLMGLPYPGGPVIAQRAAKGNPNHVIFPRPMLDSGDFNFSFSGLKTAVRYHVQKLPKLTPRTIDHLCAAVQQAIVDVLVAKTVMAAERHNVKTVLLGGGVVANTALRQQLTEQLAATLPQTTLRFPPVSYCGDNGLLAAAAGVYTAPPTSGWRRLRVDPNLSL